MRLLAALLTPLLALTLTSCGDKIEVVGDPYEGVNWETTLQLKSSLHVHTANSTIEHGPEEGTTVTPAEQIERYEELGYDVLAITDHDYVTYPWSEYGKSESKLLSIKANELSKNDNLCVYYSDWLDLPGQGPATTVGFWESIEEVGRDGGIIYLAHPMRSGDICRAEFSVDVFRKHPHVVGMEVLNVGQFERNNSIKLWDDILSEVMPERNVWGTSSDDAHSTRKAGFGWTTLLTKERTDEAVREALTNGTSLFSTPKMVENPVGDVPTVRSISLDRNASTITIEAVDCERIEWTSMGRVVAEGKTINYTTTEGVERYLRATLYGPGGATFTQAWALATE